MVLESAEYYKSKINELNSRFFLILEKFVETYPKEKLNPDYLKYKQTMEISEEQLIKLNRDMLMLRNKLENAVDTTSSGIVSKDEKISGLIKETNEDGTNFAQLKNSALGAEGLMAEEKYLYRDELIQIIAMVFGLSFITFAIYKGRKANFSGVQALSGFNFLI